MSEKGYKGSSAAAELAIALRAERDAKQAELDAQFASGKNTCSVCGLPIRYATISDERVCETVLASHNVCNYITKLEARVAQDHLSGLAATSVVRSDVDALAQDFQKFDRAWMRAEMARRGRLARKFRLKVCAALQRLHDKIDPSD